jgi:hypothetical protein
MHRLLLGAHCVRLLLPVAVPAYASHSAFSPLDGFMNQAEYESVVANMRLTVRAGGGAVWRCWLCPGGVRTQALFLCRRPDHVRAPDTNRQPAAPPPTERPAVWAAHCAGH